MYIPNSDTQNYPFCRLYLMVGWNIWTPNLMNQPITIQVLKVVKPTNQKMLLYDFGDKCNKQPNVPCVPDYTFLLLSLELLLSESEPLSSSPFFFLSDFFFPLALLSSISTMPAFFLYIIVTWTKDTIFFSAAKLLYNSFYPSVSP